MLGTMLRQTKKDLRTHTHTHTHGGNDSKVLTA